MYQGLIFLLIACSHTAPKNDHRKEVDLNLEPEVQEQFVITKKVDTITRNNSTPPNTTKTALPKKSKSITKKLESEYPDNFPEKYKEYDKTYQKIWESFNGAFLKKNERIVMKVSYLGLAIGEMELKSEPKVFVGDNEAYSFSAKLETADFYSYIYELDDHLSAQSLTESFLPLRYSLIQRESKKEIDDIQLFDRNKFLLYYRYKRYRKDKDTLTKKDEDIFIPKYAIDPFTLLYFVRGLPLAVGAEFSFPVVTRDKLWIFKMKVKEKEKISTIKGKREAYKVEAEIGEEGSFIKKGALNLWFDVAEGHILWQMRVGTKIGSLYSSVSEYDAGASY